MRPVRQTKRTLAIVAFTLASCSTPVIPASTPTRDTVTLRLYATTPMIPLLHDLTTRYTQINKGFIFETVSGNYQTVFEKLVADNADYVLTNHLPDDRESRTVMAWPIGQDGIAVITNPENRIRNLTAEQLRSIYLGHISNWEDVGGDDMAITVISREDGSGTRAEFERLVMGARQTTQSAQIAPSSAAMIESVAQPCGCIGYVSIGYIDERVNVVAIDNLTPSRDNIYENIYPLRSTIYVLGLREPEGEYRSFISWIQSQEGQSVVGQRYAPLLRP